MSAELDKIAKDIFGGVHTAGKTVLSLFGAGVIAQPLEQLEAQAGLLPDWALPQSDATAVDKAAYVVLVPTSGKPQVFTGPVRAVVKGGKRFPGNGYQPGEPFGKRFSFGYESPSRVDVGTQRFSDVKMVLFSDGSESTTRVAGNFKENTVSNYLLGSDILGAPYKPRRQVKKSLTGSVIAARAAVELAKSTGKAAISASKRKPLAGRKALTTVKGEEIDSLVREVVRDYGPDAGYASTMDIGGEEIDSLVREVVRDYGPDAGYASVTDIGGEEIDAIVAEVVREYGPDAGYASTMDILGAASPATRALAARATKIRAQLNKARLRARGADAKVKKANAALAKVTRNLDTHGIKAAQAAAKGQAAIDRAAAAGREIDAQVNLLKSLGIKVKIGDESSDKIAYDKMPGDAILYPKDKAFDRQSVGSWSIFYGPTADVGYVWVGNGWAFNFGNTSGVPAVPIRSLGNAAIARASVGGQVPVPGNVFRLARAHMELAGGTFGPLIGNPKNPDYVGLHYAPDDDKWFWKAGEAPVYATKESDEAIALLEKQEQAVLKAAADAKTAVEAQAKAAADAEKADLEAQIAKEDAEYARRAEIQVRELELEDQKLQAELSTQQARDSASFATEQQKLDLQAQRQALDYAASHPEAPAPSYTDSAPNEYAQSSYDTDTDGSPIVDKYADPYAAEEAYAREGAAADADTAVNEE